LQVREVHRIAVGDRESADTRCGEVERRRAAQPARADDERVRGAQFLLTLDPDLRQQNVPAVA